MLQQKLHFWLIDINLAYSLIKLALITIDGNRILHFYSTYDSLVSLYIHFRHELEKDISATDEFDEITSTPDTDDVEETEEFKVNCLTCCNNIIMNS